MNMDDNERIPDFIIDFDLEDICLLYKSVSKHLEILKADSDRDRDGLDERLEDLQMHLYKTILECKVLGDFG
jgi:hypothetical protein|tara:strand:- start:705 stop:920 length:216 start_codon:yes stop_codon:yes gene_type:complete